MFLLLHNDIFAKTVWQEESFRILIPSFLKNYRSLLRHKVSQDSTQGQTVHCSMRDKAFSAVSVNWAKYWNFSINSSRVTHRWPQKQTILFPHSAKLSFIRGAVAEQVSEALGVYWWQVWYSDSSHCGLVPPCSNDWDEKQVDCGTCQQTCSLSKSTLEEEGEAERIRQVPFLIRKIWAASGPGWAVVDKSAFWSCHSAAHPVVQWSVGQPIKTEGHEKSVWNQQLHRHQVPASWVLELRGQSVLRHSLKWLITDDRYALLF